MKTRFKRLLFYIIIGLLYMSCDRKTVERPNIVWIVAEDLSPEFLSIYGNETIELPNLELLAKKGIVFNNAYTPIPVCAPARSALITGMYPTTIGTHNMRTYKSNQNINEPTLGIPSYSPIVPNGVKMFTEYLRIHGYYCTNNAKEDYNFKSLDSGWDESSPEAHWRNRPQNTPFFAVFNFGITHESQIWNQSNQPLLVSPEQVPVPPIFPNNEVVRKDLAIGYSNIIRLDQQIGKIIDQLKEDKLFKKSVIFFYGDHGGPFPRYKRSLYETGIKVPLIVKLPFNQSRDTTKDDFVSFVDFAPTVLSLAGIQPPDIMDGNPFLGSFASHDSINEIYATSNRFDEKIDMKRAIRSGNYKFIRNVYPEISNALDISYRNSMPLMQNLFELHKNNQLDEHQNKWFDVPKPKTELYDLSVDPYELNNLAYQSEYHQMADSLSQKLDRWMLFSGDLGVYPEKELMNRWLIGGQNPILLPPTATIKNDSIYLESPLEDATIVYRKNGNKRWDIYTQPLSIEWNFESKAVRIGYKDSQVWTNPN